MYVHRIFSIYFYLYFFPSFNSKSIKLQTVKIFNKMKILQLKINDIIVKIFLKQPNEKDRETDRQHL